MVGPPGTGKAPGKGTRDQAAPAPVANEEGLRALGESIAAAQPKASTRRRRLKWTLGISATVVVLIVAGVGGYAWYLNHLVHRIPVKGLAAGETHGTESGTENILLVGSTDRCALKKQYIGYGICGQGVNGVNSDVVMILHLNPKTRTVSILSIPRDLFVPNARVEGANKIDAASVSGPDPARGGDPGGLRNTGAALCRAELRQFCQRGRRTGWHQHVLSRACLRPESDLDVRTVGCVHLNGFHALQVVRARHMVHKGPGVTSANPANWTPEGQSDLARIRRDHEFLRVLATAVAKKGLSNPLTDRDIIQGVAPDLTVDDGLSASHMLNLVLTYHSVNVELGSAVDASGSRGHVRELSVQGG